MKIILTIAFLSFNILIFAQQQKSAHQIQSEFYQSHPELIGREELFSNPDRPDFENVESLSHKIYGFHPYWISDATASTYYYSLLTHVAYFSAEVDDSDSTSGGFTTTRNWASTQVVNYCKNNGIKIHLTITLFSNHGNVLNSTTIRSNLINNIISQINLRNADGVNIDFEAIPVSQKNNFRLFISELGTALKANNLELVVDLPAVDWNNIFDETFFTTVNSVVDYFFLMAYDYYWKGSSTAGPISPLTTGTSVRHVTRSIDYYNGKGLSGSKLLVGFNHYGYEWPVASNLRMANTTSDGVTKTFSQIKTALAGIPSGDKFFDATFNSPWYRFQVGSQWYQTWYDDSLSLSLKYDSLKSRNCAGTGMWALGYDNPNTDLWGALKHSFASSSNPANVILADFENSVGTFTRQPTYSGSTVGISTASTSARVVEQSYNGWASLKVVLKDNSSSSSDWVVRLLSGDGNPSNNTTLTSSGYIGFWLKSSSAPNGAKVAVTIDDGAGGTELSPKLDIINSGDWILYQWNLQSSGWSNFSGGNGVVNGPNVTLDAILFYAPNNSPDWTFYIDDVSFNSSVPLPVELDAFYAVSNEKNIKLLWQTSVEINNYGFEIQRTLIKNYGNDLNLRSWQTIGFIYGSGNSNSVKSYQYIDEKPFFGKNFYRLKQINIDGSFKYYDEIEVDFGVLNDFYLEQNYPNPFNSSTKISYFIPNDSFVKLEVYNLLGEIITVLVEQNQQAGYYTTEFDAGRFPSGNYIVRLMADEKIKSIKISLVK